MSTNVSTSTENKAIDAEKAIPGPVLPDVREEAVSQEVSRPAQGPQVKTDLRSDDLGLFHDVLVESSGFQRKRRTFAAVLSFVVQCFVLGVLLIVPLMFTDVLPQGQLLTFLMAPPPPPPPPPAASVAAAKVVRRVESDLLDGRLRTPSRIPQNVKMIREEEAPPDLSGGGVPGGVPGGIPGGQIGGVIGGILSSVPVAVALPKFTPPAPKRIRVSQGVTEGQLIQKIEPQYPTLARAARVQGQVRLTAIISKTGEIENLTLISGHPLLAPSAIEAVKHWHYRPFLLNGVPVEVETTITVNFQLS
jgi:protein TonB